MKRFVPLVRASTPLVLVGALLLPGLVAPPRAVAATPCPTDPVTVRDLIRLAEDRGPVLEDRGGLDAISVSGRAAACFGSRKLRVTAFVANGIIGDVTPWSLKPTWMVEPGLFLYPARRLANHGEYGLGPFLMAATPPSLGDVQARYRNRWVVVTGRYDDRVAASCRPTGLLRAAPSRREAREICRGIFVVSSIQSLGAPATTTAGAAAPGDAPPAATNPCPYPNPTMANLETLAGGYLADTYSTDPMLVVENAPACYGSRTLRFTAFVRDPGAVGWAYPFGLKPAWFRAGSFFVASRADLVPGEGPISALAVPPALGDLQAAHVGHWVVVTGHFGDPAAATCHVTDAHEVAPSAAEAVAICRSTFVVESVTRTSPPTTATVGDTRTSDETGAPPVDPGYVAGWLALSVALGGLLWAWLRERRRPTPAP